MRVPLKTLLVVSLLYLASPLRLPAPPPTFVSNLTDNLDNLSHFFSTGSGAGFIQSNGDGSATIWRTNASVDGVYDWGRESGAFDYLLRLSAPVVKINAVAPTNGGYWLTTWLLLDSSWGFIAEPSMQPDTQTTGIQSYTVPESVNGTNVYAYRVRFRMNPWDSTDVGFTFTSIEAVAAIPEPGTAIVLLAGSALLLFLRRR